MSDQIKHECGIAFIRLLKPLSFYTEKYGSPAWGLRKLYLLMEKQRNRGQEGAGVGVVRLDSPPGQEYIFRERATGTGAIDTVFGEINRAMNESQNTANEPDYQPFIGEIYIGHLRYSTTGRSGISHTHPFLRRNNWKSRNLCLAGNFNLTNVDEVMADLTSRGQHPRHNADTFIMLEQLGFLLDEQVEDLYTKYRSEGFRALELSLRIEDNLDTETIIRESSAIWDGGFAIVGSTGSGDAFMFRDRWGIRPAHYYMDDEVIVGASERAVIQTVMDVDGEKIMELGPGQALLVRRNGEARIARIHEAPAPKPCSFERIYFSRGTDRDIYAERKTLGRNLVPRILEIIGNDLDNTVFSFIPNTAEVAWFGMMEGLGEYLDRDKALKISAGDCSDRDRVETILSRKVRTEKIAVKDIKLRTFITGDSSRNDLATHVYDVTYGTVRPGTDSVAVIDDSIVRGTTLRQSIVKILWRLRPREIIIVSSSPQIRYPDCYGIDMSRMEEFIAFNAAISLLEEKNMKHIIGEVYKKCKAQENLPKEEVVNYVKEIYESFTDREISARIAEMVTPEGCGCPVKLIFQTVEGLHRACPDHSGDWYFTGDYPTPGGNRIVNTAFINWYEKRYATSI